MWWWLGGRRLRERGILGINRRNAECIAARNPRSLLPVVDDKLLMRELCDRLGIPTPAVHAVFRSQGELGQLSTMLPHLADTVIKPCRGSGGKGIVVLLEPHADGFRSPNDAVITLDDLHQHLLDIFSGMHSLGGRPDVAMVQQRVHAHPVFDRIRANGTPDVRVLVHEFEPIMAMLRVPTFESNGRANLHQGGIGVGIDMVTGYTFRALHKGRVIDRHPDTGEPLLDREIPSWHEIPALARRVARAVGLGFLGVDVVIDAHLGPMLLEANARPGLAIQSVNNAGLLHRMQG